MIDIHCHILPGVDDGPKTEAEALEMARAAEEEGIHTIIATPHHQNGAFTNYKADITAQTNNFNQLLQSKNIPITVLPGQETRIYGEMAEGLENGEILTLNNNGKYFFVELPHDHVPRYTGKLLYNIQLKGYSPVIVHPERNRELQETPDMLYSFVKNGALTQVTSGSLLGGFGSRVKKFSEDIVKADLVHILASDAHDAGRRSFRMREAYEAAEKMFGQDIKVQWLENADRIAHGDSVLSNPPQHVKKKKLFGFLKL